MPSAIISLHTLSCRCQRTPLASFKTYHEACQSTLQNIYHQKNIRDIKAHVLLNKLHESQTETAGSCNFCGYISYTRSELATHLSMGHSVTVFHCEICDGIFCESKTQFIRHMEKHEDQFKTIHTSECKSAVVFTETSESCVNKKFGTYPCVVCGRIFTKKSEMMKHMRSDHEVMNIPETLEQKIYLQKMNDKFSCSTCEGSTTKTDVKRNSKSMHFLKVFKDRSENSKGSEELQQTSESSSYSNAVRNPNLSSKFICSKCGKSFVRKCDVVRHIRYLHFTRENLYDIVGVAENVESDLVIISMASNKEMTCVICGRMFTRKADMKRHVKNVHDIQQADGRPDERHEIESFAADIHPPVSVSGTSSVVKTNVTSSDVRIDIKKEDKNNSDDAISCAKIKVDGKTYFQCHVCSKNLFRRCTYVRHMRIHTGEKPFTCHVCGKQFRAEPQIQRHVREVHEGVKEHACPICGRKFANTRTRNDHVTVHTGERRLVCHLCGKRFKTRATFHTHKRSHTDLFPHKCTYCGKSFRRQYECTKHMMIHTGERPHSCDICGKCFRYQNDMTRHKLIHSDYKPFKCAVCHLSFRQERYLKNHNMKTHKASELGSGRDDVRLDGTENIN